ncbi:MAG: type II toxin-antitoxin system HicB family antitoxin [Vulcanimicrobiota bacterium]
MKYPAKVIKEKEGFSIIFIDFPNAFTQADTVDELKENAEDVLSMAIKHFLDKGRDVPQPSEVSDADIILVEPFPEIRQRMGHKSGCECPVCRNARGDRKRTKVSRGFNLNPLALEKLSTAAKKKKVSQNALLEEIIMKAL